LFHAKIRRGGEPRGPSARRVAGRSEIMVSETRLSEYLDEIREEVCSRCVERLPGGPPCAPLGKQCGVEMHLPQIVDAIHEVRSDWIESYLENSRQRICESCALNHSSICPCPMDYLAVLLVQAVETVDKRREEAGEPGPGREACLVPDEMNAMMTATGIQSAFATDHDRLDGLSPSFQQWKRSDFPRAKVAQLCKNHEQRSSSCSFQTLSSPALGERAALLLKSELMRRLMVLWAAC